MPNLGLQGNGFGCIVATKNVSGAARAAAARPPGSNRGSSPGRLRGKARLEPATLDELLRVMWGLASRTIASFSAEFHYESQEMVPIGPTAVRSQHSTGPTSFWTISRAFSSSTLPHTRCGPCSTWCPG